MSRRGDSPTFATLLSGAVSRDESFGSPKPLYLRLLIPTVIVGGLLVAWAACAPLSGAVIAPALVKVELNRKTVEHQEGGIVRQLLVRDGERVRAGQPLLVIGDARGTAELNVIEDQIRAERARAERAAAEASLVSNFQPAATKDAPGEYLARESALFVARRRTLDEELSALQVQERQAEAEADALQLQVDASDAAARLAKDELVSNQKLLSEGFVQRARILQLQRAEAESRSKVAEGRGKLAASRERIAEIRASMARARNQYQQHGTDELKESNAKLRELQERLEPSLDQVERQTVRSPVDGEVMSLHVSGVGAVVAPREPLMDVVPSQERLVIEAHVRPQDINFVHRDALAQVRLTSFDARTTPLLTGKVTVVSGDRVSTADGRDSFFVAIAEVDAAMLESHPDIRLQPGMPAELYIAAGRRTLLEYLLRPMRVFAARAMREP